MDDLFLLWIWSCGAFTAWCVTSIFYKTKIEALTRKGSGT